MQAVVDWVLAKRHRSLLLTVVLTPFLPAAAGLLTMETVHRGVRHAVLNALPALAAAALIERYADAVPGALTRWALFGFMGAIAAGVLLQRVRSLGAVFQWLILICCAAAVLFGLAGAGGGWMLGPVLEQLLLMLAENGATAEQIERVRTNGLPLLVLMMFAQVLGGLLLAYWWISLAAKEARFGAEFRRIALGRTLGLLASVAVTVGLAIEVTLVQNLSAWALVGFLFQGSAVLHAWAHARQWHVALVAPLYVLLLTPLMPLLILAFAAVGLIDNWFDLRAPLQPRS